jgi:hypothetical protein
MSLFNNLFKSHVKEWNIVLSDNNVPDEFKAIVRLFFIKDGIDFNKYKENEKANSLIDSIYGGMEDFEIANSLSFDPDVRNLKINCTPTFKAHYVNNRENRNPFLPDWYYIAYPDVALWMHKNSDLFKDESERRKDELVNEDGPKPAFFRMFIDGYKKHAGKKLECSF